MKIIIIISIILILLLTGLALPSYGQCNPLGPLTIARDLYRMKENRKPMRIRDREGYLRDRTYNCDIYEPEVYWRYRYVPIEPDIYPYSEDRIFNIYPDKEY